MFMTKFTNAVSRRLLNGMQTVVWGDIMTYTHPRYTHEG